jgi:hypothetical protein
MPIGVLSVRAKPLDIDLNTRWQPIQPAESVHRIAAATRVLQRIAQRLDNEREQPERTLSDKASEASLK